MKSSCIRSVREGSPPQSEFGLIVRDLDDCFDFLRQAIQCHGDVSMMHILKHSDSIHGKSLDSDQLVDPDSANRKGPSVFWDVEHSCRAMAPIQEWVAAHQL